jgi:electron transport complex protein RnfD
MIVVSACAAAAIIQSAFFDGGHSLIVAAAALAAALLVEIAVCWPRAGLRLMDASAVVTALVLTLILPNMIHPALAAAGAAFAIGVVKHCFGGLGANWFNPALGGWLFIRFSWPSAFSKALQSSPLAFISAWMEENQGAGGASPVTILGKNGFGTQNGGAITQFLNDTVFSLFHIEMPAAYVDFFIDPGAALIADRGLFALLAGSVIMTAAMAGRSMLSALYIAALLLFTRLGGALPFGGPAWGGDMLFAVFSGATLAAAFFIVIDPGTSPKSPVCRISLALFAAFLTFYFRYVKAEACGALFAAAAVNSIAPLVSMAEEKLFYERSFIGRHT